MKNGIINIIIIALLFIFAISYCVSLIAYAEKSKKEATYNFDNNIHKIKEKDIIYYQDSFFMRNDSLIRYKINQTNGLIIDSTYFTFN